MFKKINANGVINDKGIALQIINPEILEYRDNDRTFEVGLGDDNAKRITYIYASISANHYKMMEIEKNKMINNIKEALKLLEGNFIVI